jgi:hypothetical protein
MKYVINTRTRLAAVFSIADVTVEEFESAPLSRADRPLHVFEVMSISRKEIVHADHGLIELEQRFEEIGPDKSGDSRNQPLFWISNELVPYIFKSAHN